MSSLQPVQATLPWKASDAIFWGKADGEAGSNRPLTSSDELCRNRHYVFKHTANVIGSTQLKIIFKLCTSVMQFSTLGKRNTSLKV